MSSDLRRSPLAPPADADDFLAQTELLIGLDPSTRAAIAQELQWYRIDGQDAVIVEGDQPDGVFLLHSGTLRALSSQPDGTWVVLREHRRGEVIGETSILAGTPRTATVVAVRDSVVAMLPRTAFLRLVDDHASLGRALAHVLSTRLIVRTPPPRNFRFVAVVPIDNASTPLSLWNPLLSFLAEGADAEVLSPADLAIGDRFEQSDRVHLVDCRLLSSEALDRVLRQADRIVAVLHPSPGSVPDAPTAAAVRAIVTGPAGPDCVGCFVQPGAPSMPRSTTALRVLVGAISHHHVRASHLSDAHAVGRSLAGTDVSIVLGGGGARGAAHIGVLKACDALGVNADRLGGTSMGAIAGSVHAAGFGWEAMLETLKRFERSGAMREVSFPTVSFLGTSKLDTILRSVLGTADIDDLWRPFFCTSVNLTTGHLDVHEDGPAASWVRASGAVPGVFPPVVGPDGSLHIDGGLLNNLPADVMRSRTRGHVLLVDVAAPTATMAVDPARIPPLGWRDVRARIKKQPTFPSVVSTLQRGTLLTSTQQRAVAIEAADLLIEPPLAEFGLFDFGSIDDIVERGYRTAMELIPAWMTANRIS